MGSFKDRILVNEIINGVFPYEENQGIIQKDRLERTITNLVALRLQTFRHRHLPSIDFQPRIVRAETNSTIVSRPKNAKVVRITNFHSKEVTDMSADQY